MAVHGSQITLPVYDTVTVSPVAGAVVNVDPPVYLDAKFTNSVSALTSTANGVVTCYAYPGVYLFAPTDPGVSCESVVSIATADVGGSSVTPFVQSVTQLLAGKQPLDSDLTAIAALSTTAFGRSLLTMANAAAVKAVLALVKGDVGLPNVDNTADTAKPVSTAQQTALNLKADLVSPTFTGDPKAPTPSAGDNDTSIATSAFVAAALAAQHTTDNGIYQALLAGTINTATSGTLTANTAALISASGGNVSRALPTTAPVGAQIIVGKTDTSTNTVTATGTINGVASQSVVLSAQGETVLLDSDGAGGWIKAAGNVSAWADSRYQLAGTAVGAQLDYAVLATGFTQTFTAGSWLDLTGTPIAITPVLGSRAVEIETAVCLNPATAASLAVGIYDAVAGAVIGSETVTLAAAATGIVRVKMKVNPGAGARGYRPQIKALGSSPSVSIFGLDNVNKTISDISCVQR